jgi:hypothetical protein
MCPVPERSERTGRTLAGRSDRRIMLNLITEILAVYGALMIIFNVFKFLSEVRDAIQEPRKLWGEMSRLSSRIGDLERKAHK